MISAMVLSGGSALACLPSCRNSERATKVGVGFMRRVVECANGKITAYDPTLIDEAVA